MNEINKARCADCDCEIMEDTSRRTGGYCMPCAKWRVLGLPGQKLIDAQRPKLEDQNKKIKPQIYKSRPGGIVEIKRNFNPQHPANENPVSVFRKNVDSMLTDVARNPPGTHPDVIDWVWVYLGDLLSQDCRCTFFNCPALIAPYNGIVIAVGHGTSYSFRCPPTMLEEMLNLEYASVTARYFWLGEDWLGGKYNQEIETRCLNAFLTLPLTSSEVD